MLDGTWFYECICTDEREIIMFVLSSSKRKHCDETEVYVSVELNQFRGFFGRLWVALKYILNLKSQDDPWSTWTLPEDKIEDFYTMFCNFKDDCPGDESDVEIDETAFSLELKGTENTATFVYDKRESKSPYFNSDFYVQVHMNSSRNSLYRLWRGIKYTFGYMCRYGHWDDWTMKKKEIYQMCNLIERFKKDFEEVRCV